MGRALLIIPNEVYPMHLDHWKQMCFILDDLYLPNGTAICYVGPHWLEGYVQVEIEHESISERDATPTFQVDINLNIINRSELFNVET